jgi:hypothetical protein
VRINEEVLERDVAAPVLKTEIVPMSDYEHYAMKV